MISVKFRDIVGKSYVLELAPETTMGQVREKLAPEKIKCEPKDLKLSFAKKALNDTVTIGSLNLGENDCIVVMRNKKKTSAKASNTKKVTKPPPAEPIEGTKPPPVEPIKKIEPIKPKEEPKRIINYYELPVPLNDDQLRSNMDRFIRMGLNKSQYSTFLIKYEYPLVMNIPYLPRTTPDECDEVRRRLFDDITVDMLKKNPQTLENFVQRLEFKHNDFSGLYRIPQNVIEAFLEPRHLDYSKYDLTGIQKKKAEKVPDEEFLNLYEKSHFEIVDQLIKDANKAANELKSKTIETTNILTFYPKEEDRKAVRRLLAVSLNLTVLQVSKIYAGTMKDGKYDELKALEIILRINKDPTYRQQIFNI